jgi:hypothetical protein
MILTASGPRLLIASIIAVEFAIVCQFNQHERWTFRRRNLDGIILARFCQDQRRLHRQPDRDLSLREPSDTGSPRRRRRWLSGRESNARPGE